MARLDRLLEPDNISIPTNPSGDGSVIEVELRNIAASHEEATTGSIATSTENLTKQTMQVLNNNHQERSVAHEELNNLVNNGQSRILDLSQARAEMQKNEDQQIQATQRRAEIHQEVDRQLDNTLAETKRITEQLEENQKQI